MNIYEQHAMHYEKLLKEQKFDEMNKDEIECKKNSTGTLNVGAVLRHDTVYQSVRTVV